MHCFGKLNVLCVLTILNIANNDIGLLTMDIHGRPDRCIPVSPTVEKIHGQSFSTCTNIGLIRILYYRV